MLGQNMFLIFSLSFMMLFQCSDKSLDSSPTQKTESSKICNKQNLLMTSETFLGHLLDGNVKNALQFYSEDSQNIGNGYGINYTFFPTKDPNAIFDIIKKNDKSPMFVELLGNYEDSELVGFFQSSARGRIDSIDYLRTNHWKTFVICTFHCEGDTWKISGQTCFEDSGSPF